MDAKKVIEAVIAAGAVLTTIFMLFQAYQFMDERHAHQQQIEAMHTTHEKEVLHLKKELLETKLEIIESSTADQLKQDAAAAAFLRMKERELKKVGSELMDSEVQRKAFVERRVTEKQQELDAIDLRQERLEELELAE